MLSTAYCERKFKEIRDKIESAPDTKHGREYIRHLERIREAYNIEFLKALARPQKRRLEPNERCAYYRKEFDRTAHEVRGY